MAVRRRSEVVFLVEYHDGEMMLFATPKDVVEGFKGITKTHMQGIALYVVNLETNTVTPARIVPDDVPHWTIEWP